MEDRKEKLVYAYSGKRGYLVLDVSNLDKIDTAVLQVLISIVHTCQKTGRKYEIRGKSETLDLILECYGINL